MHKKKENLIMWKSRDVLHNFCIITQRDKFYDP
jgi:hypothetical protein